MENQLLPTIGGSNSIIFSIPPLSWITNHAPEQQVTSSWHSILRVRNKLQQESFHAALSLRVCNKLSDGLMKREKHSTHAFTAKFLRAQHGVPCYSSAPIYIKLLPRSYAIPIKSPIRSLNPYDLGSCLVVEFWIGFDWYKSF